MISTLGQLDELAGTVADIGKCGVCPLIRKEHMAVSTQEETATSPTESNMNRLTEEG